MTSPTDDTWTEAWRRHAREYHPIQTLTEDVDGQPLGVTRHRVSGFIISADQMAAIANDERKPHDDH
ncbi:hypothetical protein [Solicola gregarius]|uniref:Uncharacterized protein n=1 Tax=Solicola gregarius TaxID=2908642 RepID=A0AA46YJ72_9ACTN|nr:hypothetical protein [Solicola gregarius]UYM04215.1 hypothetical protein L0C25_16920 [Solicola gregarius]